MIDLDELKRLAGLVTPGEWAFDGLRGLIFYRPDPLTKYVIADMESAIDENAVLICLLRNNLPAIIAALETARLVRDEDWLAGIIKKSDGDLLSGEPEYLARAIIAALPKETDNAHD